MEKTGKSESTGLLHTVLVTQNFSVYDPIVGLGGNIHMYPTHIPAKLSFYF